MPRSLLLIVTLLITVGGNSVKVLINIVVIRSCSAIHVEPPVAYSCVLVENCSVRAQEAKFLTVGQAPVPNLKGSKGIHERTVCVIIDSYYFYIAFSFTTIKQ